MVGDYSRESKAEKDISLLKRGAWGPPGNETQVGGVTMWPPRTQRAWWAGPLSPGCCEVGGGAGRETLAEGGHEMPRGYKGTLWALGVVRKLCTCQSGEFGVE